MILPLPFGRVSKEEKGARGRVMSWLARKRLTVSFYGAIESCGPESTGAGP